MLFSSLKNKIIRTEGGEIIGKIKAVNIDYGTGKICELAAGSIFSFKGKVIDIKSILLDGNKIISKSGFKSFEDSPHKGNIIGVKTYTESGVYLGKVKDFDINSYLWRLSHILAAKRINSKNPLIIGDDQIVSISAKNIVVKDLVIEEAVPNLA